MSNTIKKDDPRLTAFVLGELSAAETEQIQNAISNSPELASAVEGIRGVVGLLGEAYQSEPPLSLLDQQKTELAQVVAQESGAGSKEAEFVAGGSVGSTSGEVAGSRKSRPWLPLAIAASLLGLLIGGALYFDQAANQENVAAKMKKVEQLSEPAFEQMKSGSDLMPADAKHAETFENDVSEAGEYLSGPVGDKVSDAVDAKSQQERSLEVAKPKSEKLGGHAKNEVYYAESGDRLSSSAGGGMGGEGLSGGGWGGGGMGVGVQEVADLGGDVQADGAQEVAGTALKRSRGFVEQRPVEAELVEAEETAMPEQLAGRFDDSGVGSSKSSLSGPSFPSRTGGEQVLLGEGKQLAQQYGAGEAPRVIDEDLGQQTRESLGGAIVASAPPVVAVDAASLSKTASPAKVPSHLQELGLSYKTKLVTQTKTRSVPTMHTRVETKTRMVPVTRMRTEDRTRVVDGREETYQVEVAYTENVSQTYQVQVPFTENVTQNYTVQVPVTVLSIEDAKADEIIAELASEFDPKGEQELQLEQLLQQSRQSSELEKQSVEGALVGDSASNEAAQSLRLAAFLSKEMARGAGSKDKGGFGFDVADVLKTLNKSLAKRNADVRQKQSVQQGE